MQSVLNVFRFAGVYLLFQLCYFNVESQVPPEYKIWGVASRPDYGYGNIFTINSDGSNLIQQKIFIGNIDGAKPAGGFIYHSGYLYGMTHSGGAYGFGSIIRIKPDGSDFKNIFSFHLSDGAFPFGKLIPGPDGKLYGLTYFGGTTLQGIIFRIDIDGSNFTKIFDFSGTDTFTSMGTLLLGSDGLLYGSSRNGGNGGVGTIYKINLDGTGFTKIFDFIHTETGSQAQTNLIEGTDGYLYTMTNYGAANNTGAIFKLRKDGSDYTKLMDIGGGFAFDFNGIAYAPAGNLMQAANGDLYGINPTKGLNDRGSIFRIQTDGNNYTELIDFSGINGGQPVGSLIQTADNTLYGVTQTGGTHNLGVVYKLNPDGSGFSKLYDFDGTNSGNITANGAAQLLEISGDLFGTTTAGAASNNGLLFKLAQNGNFSKLKDFPQDLIDPSGHLLHASDGMLYGIAQNGGVHGYGGVYRIKSDGSGYESIYQFDKINGAGALSNGLIEDSDGYLYGMTVAGGANNIGTIFKLKRDGTGFQKLLDFDGINGSTPYGSLTLASNGFLYGTTSDGGTGPDPYYGVVFRIGRDGTGFQVLVNFDYSNGSYPMGTLIQATDGKLYGVSAGSSSDDGGIFRMDLDGNNFQQFFNFDYAFIGGNIGQGLRFFQATDSKLYTMTSFGAANGRGAIFSLNLDGSGLSKLYDFSVTDGSQAGGMTIAPDGFIYGGRNRGSLYKIKSDGTQFSKLFNFTDYNGGGMFSAPTIIVIPKVSQTISFTLSESKAYNDPTFNLSATSTSGLPITYTSSNPAVATINGSTVTIVGAGTTTITASQAGDNLHLAATSVDQQLVVNKVNQTISFSSLAEHKFMDDPITLSATSNSGLPITYTSSNTSAATISGNTVTIIGAGTTTITASQAGNSHYLAATSVDQQLVVNKGNQTISFSSLAEHKFKDEPIILTATSNSGLPITYVSSNVAVATISNNVVTIVGAGTTVITASQAGDSNYLAASNVEQQLVVNKANQTISFSSLSDKTLGNFPFDLAATSSSGLAVNFHTTSDKISIAGTQVTLIKAGRTTIEADQSGSTNYQEATKVNQSFCINPAKPTVTLTTNADQTTLSSSATAGNQWYLNGSAIDNAVNTTFTASLPGTYTVQAQIDDCKSEFSVGTSLVITGDISTTSTEIKLYPNPTTQQLTISLPDDNLSKQISIYSSDGKIVEQINTSNEEITVSTGWYLNGSYLVRVITGENQFSKRFVKR